MVEWSYVNDEALGHAAQRLDEFIVRQARGVFFAPGEAETRAPESELSALVEAIRAQGHSAVSYGLLPDILTGEWQAAAQQWDAFLDQLREALNDPLMVETSIAASGGARTAVRWLGDTSTALVEGADPALLDQHRQTLAQALRSRKSLLRILALATEGAARLARAIAIPTSTILMLPAILKYLLRVMDEFREQEAGRVVGRQT